jgi:hypothetical protein
MLFSKNMNAIQPAGWRFDFEKQMEVPARLYCPRRSGCYTSPSTRASGRVLAVLVDKVNRKEKSGGRS